MIPEGCVLFDPCLSVPRGIWAVSPPFSLSFFPLSLLADSSCQIASRGLLPSGSLPGSPCTPPHGLHSDLCRGSWRLRPCLPGFLLLFV